MVTFVVDAVSIMVRMVAGAGAVAGSWLLWLVVLSGVGLWLAGPVLKHADIRGRDLPLVFWLGVCLTVAALQLWHLVFPVGSAALFLVFAAGLAGWLRFRQVVHLTMPPLRVVVVATLVVLFVAHHATSIGNQYDTGLYHAQVVEWTNAYPAVPGLANLHGRLAFNNASLLFGSLVDSGPWRGAGEHVANGLFIVGLAWLLAAMAYGPGRESSGARPMALLLLVPLAAMTFHADLRSFATDPIAAVVVLAAVVTIYRLASQSPEAAEPLTILVASLLCVTMVAVKLSSLGFAVPALLVIGYLVRPWRHRRLTTLFLALALVMGTGFAARGTVLSGMPAYPSTALQAPVSWRVPLEQAQAEAAWVRHTSRRPKYEIQPGPWFGTWFKNLWRPYARLRLLLPLLIALLSLAVVIRRGVPLGRSFWWPLVPVACGGAFWFLMAPSPRFGYPYAWGLAGLALAAASSSASPRFQRAVVFGVLLLNLAPVADPMVRAAARGEPPGYLISLFRSVLIVPPPLNGVWHPMPRSEVARFVTDSGLVISVPVDRDTCWRAALPCTPIPAPNLRLRVPGELRHGFVVDGDWNPLIFPSKGVDWLRVWRCNQRGACRTE